VKLEGDYLFDASVTEVWGALFDPIVLAAVLPGCEKLDLIDGQFVGDLKVKVGPIQGTFSGKVDLKDKVEPRSYTMIVDGRGAPGFVKATASVKLEPDGEGTRIHYDADAQIGGKIASVGQRLVEASARAMVAQSLSGLHENIKIRAAAYRAATETAAAAAPASTPTPAVVEPVLTTAPAAAQVESTPAAEATPKVAPAAAPAVNKATAAAAAAPEPKPAPVVAFTPIRVNQSDLAKSVAKEVASSMFPRSLLVVIILLQTAAIVWLLLRS